MKPQVFVHVICSAAVNKSTWDVSNAEKCLVMSVFSIELLNCYSDNIIFNEKC